MSSGHISGQAIRPRLPATQSDWLFCNLNGAEDPAQAASRPMDSFPRGREARVSNAAGVSERRQSTVSTFILCFLAVGSPAPRAQVMDSFISALVGSGDNGKGRSLNSSPPREGAASL